MKTVKDTMLNVRVTKELAKKFKIMCMLNNHSQSQEIQELLENYVATYEKQLLELTNLEREV